MEQEKIQKYTDVIASAYKSLDEPDFSFVQKVFDARPYDPLIKRLRDYAAVEDLASAEDDVCFSYFLKGRAQLWKLDLSVVGPFGVFVRVKGALVAPTDFLYAEKVDLIAFERKVADVSLSGGIRLMTVEDLSTRVPLSLFNTQKEEVTLYQALFSDRKLALHS